MGTHRARGHLSVRGVGPGEGREGEGEHVTVSHTYVSVGSTRACIRHTYVRVGHTSVSIGHTRVRVSHNDLSVGHTSSRNGALGVRVRGAHLRLLASYVDLLHARRGAPRAIVYSLLCAAFTRQSYACPVQLNMR